MTPSQAPKYDELVTALRKLRDRSFRYPNSDYYEYCSCGRSPYNVPRHEPGCLTVMVNDLLDRIDHA